MPQINSFYHFPYPLDEHADTLSILPPSLVLFSSYVLASSSFTRLLHIFFTTMDLPCCPSTPPDSGCCGEASVFPFELGVRGNFLLYFTCFLFLLLLNDWAYHMGMKRWLGGFIRIELNFCVFCFGGLSIQTLLGRGGTWLSVDR
jgi:hypothetical protein